MKTTNKCPRCSAKRCAPDLFECRTEECRDFDSGDLTGGLRQSDLCRERVKVAKLKKRIETMEMAAKDLFLSNHLLRKENDTLRNPNF